MSPEINTHNMICDFGRHRGTPYTRMPVAYLKWMVNSGHSRADVAQAELDRRGTTTQDEFDVSGHAVDRASNSCLGFWQRTRRQNEGLHAWLIRLGKVAIEQGKEVKPGKIAFAGMLWCFEKDGCWPVLKTVMRDKVRHSHD